MMLLTPRFSLGRGPCVLSDELLAAPHAFLPVLANSKVSVHSLAPYIFGNKHLNWYAITRFLKDGCFWAYLPAVYDICRLYDTQLWFGDLNLGHYLCSLAGLAYPASPTPGVYAAYAFGVWQKGESFRTHSPRSVALPHTQARPELS